MTSPTQATSSKSIWISHHATLSGKGWINQNGFGWTDDGRKIMFSVTNGELRSVQVKVTPTGRTSHGHTISPYWKRVAHSNHLFTLMSVAVRKAGFPSAPVEGGR